MSVTYRQTRSYGGAAGADMLNVVSGVATVVLAVCGLAGVYPPILSSVAVVVLGVGLVACGGTLISSFGFAATGADANRAVASGHASGHGSGLATLLLAGAAGVILGILALLGIAQQVLAAVAVIGFGVALISISGSGSFLLEAGSAEGSGSGGSVPAIAGLTSLVLGVLALAQMDKTASSLSLILVALLLLGAGATVSGSGLAPVMQRLTRQAA